MPPNILLIMSDQHRASVMGCAGDPVVRTPNLDRLATEGIRFERVYCQGPLCMPARASLLTERYVRDHGVYRNNWDTPAHLPTFVGDVAAAGYHTSCIGKMHLWVHGGERAGGPAAAGTGPRHPRARRADARLRVRRADRDRGQAGHGQHHQRVQRLPDQPRPLRHLPGMGVGAPIRLANRRRAAQAAADLDDGVQPGNRRRLHRRLARPPGRAWIESYDRDQPFFQWVGFPGPHDPWDAPADYADLYRGRDMPMPASLQRPELPAAGPFRDFLDYFLNVHSDSPSLTDAVIAEIRRYYYGNVTVIDEAIGRMLDALERRGLLDRTWVIYTSDHGEMMGEHRMLTKMVFYEPSVRVPLIIRPPGGCAPRVVDALAEHLDLAATIRDIAGSAGDPSFAGRSLLGWAGGGTGFSRPAVFSENFGLGMVRTARHKLVFVEDTLEPVQLFDLAADPLEDVNVVSRGDQREAREALMGDLVGPFLAPGPVRPDRLRPAGAARPIS